MSRTVRQIPLSQPAQRGLCDAVQGHVCRMAADAPLNVAATAVALHVRECETCSEFVNELERVRRWLGMVSMPRNLAEELDDIEPIASVALCRELLARFARDLLAVARGQSGRPMVDRARDQRQLSALTHAFPRGPGTTPEDLAGVELALHEGPIDAATALEAAAHLDPLGLDIALAWLGSLERAGRGEHAHRLTDQMLARLV